MDTILWILGAAVLIQIIVVRWICVATVAESWPKLFPKALAVGLVSGFLVLLLIPVPTDQSRSQQIVSDLVDIAQALVGSLVVVVLYCLQISRQWDRSKV